MADSIVEGLFGPSPLMIEQQRQQQMAEAARNFATMNAAQRGAMGLYQGGAGLARPVAGMLGLQDPLVAQAQAREQAMSGVDATDPESLIAAAQRTTDPRMKFQLMLLADQKKKEKTKEELDAAKAAVEWKKYLTDSDKRTPEQRNVEAIAAAKGLTPGTPEYNEFVVKTLDAFLTKPDKGTWSEPYKLGGATVQKNSVTGEIRTAVTREPVTKVTLDNNMPVLSDENLDFFANQYLLGDTQWQVGIGRSAGGAQFIAKVKNRAAELARASGVSPEDVVQNRQEIAARLKATKDFTTGVQGRMVNSFNTAIDHLATLEQLGTALNNKDTQLINKIGNTIATWTGEPAPVSFDAAKRIVGQEITKAIVANGGGVKEREEAAASISSANSPAQLNGVIKTYKELLAGQLKSLGLQYEQTTKRKDFKDKLTPRAKQELESIAPSQPVAKPSATGIKFLGFEQ